MKICSRCGDEKKTDDFAYKNKAKGRRHSHCKGCQSGIGKKHYIANKGEYIERAKDRYLVNSTINGGHVDAYLKAHPCEGCQESDIKVLGFVPKQPGVKSRVRRLIGHSWEMLEAEIKTCSVLCANCRRKR
jgi:hypothetical protein